MYATLDGEQRYMELRAYLGRLSSDTAALQALTAASDGTALTWMRNGAGPEVAHATFEQSTDGLTYTLLGGCTCREWSDRRKQQFLVKNTMLRKSPMSVKTNRTKR